MFFPYEYKLKNKICHKSDETKLRTYIYVFKTRKGRTYIVNIEEYKFCLFVIKYYLKNHKLSKNRYKIIINDFDAFRILSTCISIASDIIKINNIASFGFIGNRSMNESSVNTKRFRIYKQKAITLFSPDNFIHKEDINNSSYLLINRKNSELDLFKKITDMLHNYYIDFD